jgi:hypothetical protein
VAELAGAETSYHTILHIDAHSLKPRNVKILPICFYMCMYVQSDYSDKREKTGTEQGKHFKTY